MFGGRGGGRGGNNTIEATYNVSFQPAAGPFKTHRSGFILADLPSPVIQIPSRLESKQSRSKEMPPMLVPREGAAAVIVR